VQQGKEIDWFDLCHEAGFSPAIVFEINDAKAKAMNEPLGQRLDEFGLVPVQCGHHVRHFPLLLVLFPVYHLLEIIYILQALMIWYRLVIYNFSKCRMLVIPFIWCFSA